MYKAICFKYINKRPYPPVILDDVMAVWDYVNYQKRLFPEIHIHDSNGTIAVIARDGKVVLPRNWASIEMNLVSQL